MAAAAAKAGVSGGSHPLADRRWLRLALIITSCLICSGIAPGMAVIEVLLVEAGVGSSLCGGGVVACEEQYLFVSERLTMATGVSLLLYVFAGWLFDRVGGHVLGQLGAAVSAVGFLLLQIPLYGARHGLDGQTRGWLLFAVIFAEIGSALATTSVMSVAWHFHDFQTVVAACIASTDSAAAILPNILSALMQATGLSLSPAMLVWLALVVLAGVCCRYTVPDMEEYRAQGESVLGALPPTDKMSFWQMFSGANAVLLPHWWMHLILVIAVGASNTTTQVYAGVLGNVGVMLFGSAAAAEKLTSTLTAFTCVGGAVTAPAISFVSDSVSQGVIFMLSCPVALGILMGIFVVQTTWLAQVLACVCSSQLFAIVFAYCNRHCLAFAGPARIGIVFGLVQTYVSLVYFALSGWVYSWMSSLESTAPEQLTLPLQASSIVAVCLFIALASCVLIVGFPQEPVALAEDTVGLPSVSPPKPCKGSM